MFLTNCNKILWRKMGLGAVVTFVLVLAGVFVFDKPLFMFLRQFNGWVCTLFDRVFGAEVWIIFASVLLIALYVKKILKSDINFKDDKDKFNLIVALKNSVDAVRTSHAFLIFCSVVSAGIIVKILKIVIGRARPVFFEALDMTGFYPPSLDWAFNSMPSGHTTVTFAGLVMIGMLAPRYKPWTWTLAIVVGLSRVMYGAHWPSDVLLGAFIGMVVADIVKFLLLGRQK